MGSKVVSAGPHGASAGIPAMPCPQPIPSPAIRHGVPKRDDSKLITYLPHPGLWILCPGQRPWTIITIPAESVSSESRPDRGSSPRFPCCPSPDATPPADATPSAQGASPTGSRFSLSSRCNSGRAGCHRNSETVEGFFDLFPNSQHCPRAALH